MRESGAMFALYGDHDEIEARVESRGTSVTPNAYRT